MALSVKRVRRLKKPGRYIDDDGLYLQVMTGSNRSWLLRFERQGRERWMGLGSAELFTLAEARERAREARKLLADGIDPIDARGTQRAQRAAEAARSKTFAEAAQAYFDAHESSWSAHHRTDFIGSLTRHAFPKLGSLPVSICCQLEAITRELSRFKEGPPRDVAMRKDYWKLTRCRGQLVMALASLSTKLRLAPSTRNDRDRTTVRARRAAQSAGLKKPWEFGTEDDLDS